MARIERHFWTWPCAIIISWSCCQSPSFAEFFRGDIDRWSAADALDLAAEESILFAGSSRLGVEYEVTNAPTWTDNLLAAGIHLGVAGVGGSAHKFASGTGMIPDDLGPIFSDMLLMQSSFEFLNVMEVTVTVPEPATATLATLTALALITSCRRTRGQAT